MAIIELFSKKQKRLRGEVIDVYQYNTIPHPLRVQVVHILRDCIGQDDYGYTNVDDCYKFLVETLCREYGLFELVPYAHNNESALSDFLLKTKSTEQALDVIDLSFKYISRIINKKYDYSREARVNMTPDEAIKELNERFKEHGVGYQFEGELIRLDSTYMHSEVTIPTLTLLSSHTYEATNNEYLNAHEHYRHGRNGECLIKCNNAFEGTMKIICKKKGWPYSEKDTAKKLIQICIDNGLIPGYMQNQFSALRALLENGIPTLRNNFGGHGKSENVDVEDKFARYGLNLTGSNIIFLVEQSGIE